LSRSDESSVAVGIALPQYGAVASPETILHVAVEAEKIGLASLWVSDRLLLPTKPKETFDGDPWPEIFATVYDPIEMLTYASARTRKVKLGTSVLCGLFQNPVILARRLATLDRLSNGRVIAGIGQADFRDEFEAANVPIKRRGRGFEEFVKVIRAVWGPDPVSFAGDFYNIPESRIGPKPVQSGGIPLLLGAFAPASQERAARIADGIMPAAGRSATIEKLSKTINDFRDMVRRAGRNPEEMKWILRVHNPLFEEKGSEPPALLGGTPQQAAEDLARVKELGIDHVFYDMNHPARIPIDTQLLLLRRLVRLTKPRNTL
jgi:probable F420-dependent oxidoreductase